MLHELARDESIIQRGLKEDFNETDLNSSISRKANMLQTANLVNGFIEMNFLTIYTLWFRQHVYEYYYGPKDKESKNADKLEQVYAMMLKMYALQGKMSLQTNNIDKKSDLLIKGQEETQRQIDSRGNQVSSKLEAIEDKVEKKDRSGRTRPLKLTTCLEAIKDVYEDPKYDYPREFELHLFAIRNMLSNWNQYLKTAGKKGKPPLPKFDFYRHTDKDTFKKWVRDVFFPDYRNRAHKDALDNASRLDTEKTPGSDGQEILDAVDESLANDSNNNARKDTSNNTKNE